MLAEIDGIKIVALEIRMFLRMKSMDFNYFYFLSFFHSERHITEQQESLESYKPGFPAQLYCLLAYNPGSIVSLSSLSFPVYEIILTFSVLKIK